MSGDETAFRNARQNTMLPDMRPETVKRAKRIAKVVTRRHYCGNRLLKISFNVAAATMRATNVSKNSIRVLPCLTSHSTVADTTSLSWNKQVSVSWRKRCNIDSLARNKSLSYNFAIEKENMITFLLFFSSFVCFFLLRCIDIFMNYNYITVKKIDENLIT